MEATATLKYLRMAPRKVRILLNEIRDENVEIALSQLRFTNKRAARHLVKLLESAVFNARIKFGQADSSELYVKAAFADEGPTLRRFRPRAMGRATRINKKTSHVTVVVAERE
jgi:large subunit ribosomal protein L22